MSEQSADPIKVEDTTLLTNSSTVSNATHEDDACDPKSRRPTVLDTRIDGVLRCTRVMKDDRTYDYSSPAICGPNDSLVLQLERKQNIDLDIPYKTVRFLVPFAVTGLRVLSSDQDQHIYSVTRQLLECFIDYGWGKEHAKKILDKITVTWVNIKKQDYLDIGWYYHSHGQLPKPHELVLCLTQEDSDEMHRLPYVGQGILSSYLPVYLPNFSPWPQEDLGKEILDAFSTAFRSIGYAREVWQQRRTLTGGDELTMMLTTYVVIIQIFVTEKGVDKLCLTPASQMPNTITFEGKQYDIYHFNRVP